MTPPWDVLLLPQPELRQDVHTDCRTGFFAIPRISYPKRSTVCLSHFPKAPILTLAQIQCIYKKSLLWVLVFANLFPTWSHEGQCRMLNWSSSHVFTAKGSPRKTGHSNWLNPLVFQPRWPCEPTMLEAVDLQS